jgi:hypothetical protein
MIVSQWPGALQIREDSCLEYRGEIVNMYPADESGATGCLAFLYPDMHASPRSINRRGPDNQS